MEHLELNPSLTEAFKKVMLTSQWIISHQDAGQTHLVGWGYEIFWQKSDQTVILRYSNKQGSETALLEMSSSALDEIKYLIELLND